MHQPLGQALTKWLRRYAGRRSSAEIALKWQSGFWDRECRGKACPKRGRNIVIRGVYHFLLKLFLSVGLWECMCGSSEFNVDEVESLFGQLNTEVVKRYAGIKRNISSWLWYTKSTVIFYSLSVIIECLPCPRNCSMHWPYQ